MEFNMNTRKEFWKKTAAFLTAMTMCVGVYGFRSYDSGSPSFSTEVVSAADTGSRIRVDINKNDGRKASYSKNAENWLLAEGVSASYSTHGVTFKLSNGGSIGGNVTGANNKKLQLQSLIYPRLTMDGAKIKDGDSGGVLKLEISGLSNGNHSLQMWHANTDGYTNSKLSISVNGTKKLTGVNCPTNVTNENDAGISYVTWSGSSVTILITPEGGGKQNVAWLNGFELDGSDPVNGVSKMTPVDQEVHHDRANGLTWTAGKNAKSHDVYVGTSYNSVFNANHNSAEFKGNQTGTKYALDDSYSSIPTYYWRVDEVSSSGTVKGAVYSFRLNRLAFPTAEGYGRFARGGRGGTVYHVTNLNDSGTGSLRYGLETVKGARTIVFDVGGVIALKSVLCIPEDGGDVYVAGQTAPGDGITLINYTFGAMGSSDVIIRDIRTRVGDVSGKSMGGMGMSSCDNSIVDHCSISWATDEGFSSRSAANLTFQWNIIGESLNNSVHYDANDRSNVERHSFAASISGYTGSFHHNLLIDNTGRNWSLAGAMEQDAVTYGGQVDIRNNVVYNWRDRTTDGGARRVQFVNNYYKAGAVSNTSLHLVSVDGNELGTSDMQKLYASGNMKVAQNGSTLIAASTDEWSSGKAKSGGKNSTNNDVKSDKPFYESYVNTETAENAYKSVIAQVGANYPKLDYIDSRYINEVKNGKYTYTGSKDGLKGIIDSQNDVGGYPSSSNFKGGTAPIDTDKDGMPDTWENSHGLDPKNASDGAIVSLSADDYTNLELYLNELAGDNVDYNGNVQRDPVEDSLVSVEVLDTSYYNSWHIDNSLAAGDMVFGDRTADRCSITEFPENLNGAEIVLTPCDAKVSSKDQAAVTALKDITLYVGLDSRVAAVPSWLGSAEKTGQVIKTSNDVTFELYALTVSTGKTVTLGSNGQSASCMNYIVVASEKPVKIIGDVNVDKKLDTSDYVLLKKWLLKISGTTLADWKEGDLLEDNKLNVYDLVIMKRLLVGSGQNTAAPSVQRQFSFTVASNLFDQSNTDTLGLSNPSGAETVTVWKAAESGDHFCNGVCLAEFKDKLYCQWQSSETNEDSDDTHVMYAVSSDGGKTWSSPQVLAQNIGSGYCTSGGWLATGDKLVAYINFWDSSLSVKGGYTYYVSSSDGSSWTSPAQVKMADGSPLNGIFEQDPHVLSSGRIVNAAHFQEGLMVYPIYTDDPSGVSGWKKGDFTPTPNGTQSVEMEPSLFVQSDGTLAMIFRDQTSSYTKLISYSLDDGKTWSKAQATTMPDARTKQSAGNLSDGTAFMVGSPVNNNVRSPLAVTFSKNGKSFDKAYVLRSNSSLPQLVYTGTAKKQGFHYSKSLVANGNLYVGYATNKEAVEVTIVPEKSISLN